MIKLINGWTKQTVMEQVKKYNDGTKAMTENEYTTENEYICTYQNNSGNRCAVGCFVPDNHAALSFQGNAVRLLQVYSDLVKLMPFSIDDIGDFQIVHDVCHSNEHQGNTYSAIQDFLDNEVEGE